MSRTVSFACTLRARSLACTLAVGGLIALQPPANAALARHVGDLGAALISAAITVTILACDRLSRSPGRGPVQASAGDGRSAAGRTRQVRHVAIGRRGGVWA